MGVCFFAHVVLWMVKAFLGSFVYSSLVVKGWNDMIIVYYQ